jgi:hypothetical protein
MKTFISSQQLSAICDFPFFSLVSNISFCFSLSSYLLYESGSVFQSAEKILFSLLFLPFFCCEQVNLDTGSLFFIIIFKQCCGSGINCFAWILPVQSFRTRKNIAKHCQVITVFGARYTIGNQQGVTDAKLTSCCARIFAFEIIPYPDFASLIIPDPDSASKEFLDPDPQH